MNKNNTNDKDLYLRCSTCGKVVSNVPFISDPVIRAYIECPECVEEDRLEKRCSCVIRR